VLAVFRWAEGALDLTDQHDRVAADDFAVYPLARAHDLRLARLEAGHTRVQRQLERVAAAVEAFVLLEERRSGTWLEAERSPRRTKW
jgi:hypothetical protein